MHTVGPLSHDKVKILLKEQKEEVVVVYGKVFLLWWFACSLGFEAGFPDIGQSGFKLMALLPLPLQCKHCRCVLPRLLTQEDFRHGVVCMT